MRILALDIGQKTCGICISDETNTIAIPLENFHYNDFDLKQLKNKIIYLLEEYRDITLILIGYPLKTTGEKSTISIYIDKFIKEIYSLNINIKKIDERFSTQRGLELLNTKKDAKKYKDVLAAYVLLHDYLSFV